MVLLLLVKDVWLQLNLRGGSLLAQIASFVFILVMAAPWWWQVIVAASLLLIMESCGRAQELLLNELRH